MKKLKRVLACVLSLCLLAIPPVTAAAANTVTPLIVLQGYSGPRLDDAATGEQVWGLDFDAVGQRILDALPDILGTAGDTFTGDTTALVDVLGGIVQETLEPVLCNPDGTSKYDLVPHIQTAQQACVCTLRMNGEEALIAEKELVAMFEERIGSNNVFIFNFDWRKGQMAYADAIDDFIGQVKALTGAKQVDLFGLSHGGQCGASYLYQYGWKGDVRKAMLDSPAIGGTSLVGDLLLGNPIDIDYATILQFVELGLGTENEFEGLLRYIGFENLNAVVADLFERYVVDILQNIPSIWDFCPLDVYEEAKAKRLDTTLNAELIKQSDSFHYGILQNMRAGLERAQNAGTEIAIVTKYGFENVTGSNINSDYIIDTALSSGAYCAPFDETFSDSYTQSGDACTNSGHLHISPERNIDASYAYLPDNTWFVRGQFHGMYVFDPYTVSLVQAFYFTDTLKDVFSDPNFPQFNATHNPVDSLFVRFDATSPGYHSGSDGNLLFYNLSEQHEIAVQHVEVIGAPFDVQTRIAQRIAPGESGGVTISAHDLAACEKPFTLRVTYTLFNPQLLLKTEDFVFTPLTDGEARQFAYLIADTPQTPDISIQSPNRDTTTDEPETTAPATEPSTSAGNTQAEAAEDIPGTGGTKLWSLLLWAIPVAGAVAVVPPAVRRRKHR